MSGKNNGGSEFGGMLAGIAALITALVGLLVYFGIQPKQSGQSPEITEPSGSLENAPQPSEFPAASTSPDRPSHSLCPSKMTFSELYDFNSRNPLQAKDVCENQTLTLIGYLNSTSVYECPYQNELKETVQGRCLRVLHDKQYFYENTIFQYTENEKDLLIEVNKSLYQNGNHTVTIQAEVSFPKDEYQQQIIRFANVKILSYQPLSN